MRLSDQIKFESQDIAHRPHGCRKRYIKTRQGGTRFVDMSGR